MQQEDKSEAKDENLLGSSYPRPDPVALIYVRRGSWRANARLRASPARSQVRLVAGWSNGLACSCQPAEACQSWAPCRLPVASSQSRSCRLSALYSTAQILHAVQSLQGLEGRSTASHASLLRSGQQPGHLSMASGSSHRPQLAGRQLPEAGSGPLHHMCPWLVF